MTQQIISTGNMANDHRGDSLRTAGSKINDNFTEVYIASQGAYDQANTSFALAQSAFELANTDFGDIRFSGSWIHNKDTGPIYISPQDGNTWIYIPSDIQAVGGQALSLGNYDPIGSVQIEAGNTGNTWVFNHDGTLTLPNGSTLENYNGGTALYSTTGPAVLFSNVSGNIEAVELRAKGNGGDSSVILKSDGTLTVPGVITGTETAPSWTHNITNITLGTDTIITFDASVFYGPVIGQVIIEGLDSTVEANGTWYYQAWETNAVKLFTDNTATIGIDSTIWTPYTSGGTITNLNYGGVSIQANENIWDFKADGSLKVPGDIIVGSSPNPSGKEQHYIIDATNYWTSIQWKNMTSLQTPAATPFECQAQLLRVFANDNTVTAWCNLNNPREELIALTAIQVDNTKNGFMFSTSDGKIPDAPYNDGTGTRHDWIFHGDGTTQLPYMPTNNRTGNADALIFTKINGRTGQKVIGTQSGTVDNPTVERLVIAGGDGYGTGEGGDIYLWAGRSSVNANGGGAGGGDIKVDAGDAYDIDGGTIKIRGGNSNVGSNNLAHPGGWIEIDAGSSYNGGNGADITLNAGNAYNGGTDGKITVRTGKGTHSWEFGNDGAITFPDGSNQKWGMGNLIGVQDGEWVLGEYNGSDFGTSGIRIMPSIVGPTGLWLPSTNNSTNTAVRLTNFSTGGVTIESNSNTWIFGEDSVLTIPGEIKSTVNTGPVVINSSDNSFTYSWTFGETGTLTLPGSVVNSTANSIGTGDNVYPTALDLTKTINKLTDNTGSYYTLADGVEGQIMYLVPKDGATVAGIAVFIEHARILNNATTTATVINNPEYFPFTGAATNWNNNMATLIFTDGAWNVSTGSFDY